MNKFIRFYSVSRTNLRPLRMFYQFVILLPFIDRIWMLLFVFFWCFSYSWCSYTIWFFLCSLQISFAPFLFPCLCIKNIVPHLTWWNISRNFRIVRIVRIQCFKHSFHRSLAIIAGTFNHRRPCSFTCTFPQSLSFGQFSCYIFLIRFYCLTLIDFSIFNSIDHWKIHWIHRTNKNVH